MKRNIIGLICAAVACASLVAFKAPADPQVQQSHAVVILMGSETVNGGVEVYVASSSIQSLDCRNMNMATAMANLLDAGFHIDKYEGLIYTLVR